MTQDIYCIFLDSGYTSYTFFKITLPEPFPNTEDVYNGKDFIFERLSGDEELFNNITRYAKHRCYNGKCWAYQDLMFRTYIDRKTMPSRELYNAPNRIGRSSEADRSYEILCIDKYFGNEDPKNYEVIMAKELDDFITGRELLKNMKAFL